jgi:hypothetical protein
MTIDLTLEQTFQKLSIAYETGEIKDVESLNRAISQSKSNHPDTNGDSC